MREDGAGDGLPVGSFDSVSGSVEREQPCTGDLPGQRLSVLEREHRIRRAVDHQCGDGDRGQRFAGQLAFGGQAVVLGSGDVARARRRGAQAL